MSSISLHRIRLETWRTALGDITNASLSGFDDSAWKAVRVPHNWDDYHGYPAVSHGNLHGTAWYRTPFTWSPPRPDARLHAFFEGVGSYVSVYCNGQLIGEHAGGRTTFTLDLTSALRTGDNVLAVRAHHPEKIADLPFVCGGCWGSPNTEGSQPFGLFRPAWLETTGPVRITPFGVHILTPHLDHAAAVIEVHTELFNPGLAARGVHLNTRLVAPEGTDAGQLALDLVLAPGELRTVTQRFPSLAAPQLWSPITPLLHTAHSTVTADGAPSHQIETTFGLRWVEWPVIAEPNADRNVRSPDGRGRLVSNGDIPPAPSNNHHTLLTATAPTTPVTLAPAGVAIRLADTSLFPSQAALHVDLSLCGHGEARVFIELQNEGGTLFFQQHRATVAVATTSAHRWTTTLINQPQPWRADSPYLHKLVIELRSADGTLWQRAETTFGFRQTDGLLNLARPVYEEIARPDPHAGTPLSRRVLRINGEPVFLNGTCEYEHLLGCDHAFTDEQVAADVAMMLACGFNAFRDAHHPHNLRYYDAWDRAGVLCWTQMGSRFWFDTPAFRENFLRLTAEWVRERRNSPSVLIWGIQNESALPEAFAREVTALIRSLDPTSPAWRITTTCNGGKGSDWNVPQEWSGTYGGNCHDYDLARLQLVGEYGAWRNFGQHTETDYRGDENDRSESWACFAMETKIRLGEAARDRAVGHFHWIFNSFQNPGRTADNYEGVDPQYHIGSVNNKGLVTAWHQPSDLFHLYRSNYADPVRDPMVYIVSHTWSERFHTSPRARRLRIYSNAEEVELFNGHRSRSLGVRRHPGRGRHFVWEDVDLTVNTLHAVARIGGRDVAEDFIAFDHLPADHAGIASWSGPAHPALDATPAGRALHRVNCGATADHTDAQGRVWSADHHAESWAGRFPGVAPDLASRGHTPVPVQGAADPALYREYRYGREPLKWRFPVAPGRHLVRLHLSEPWFGVGGAADCAGWRRFDVAINDQTLARDIDIWAAAGGAHRAHILDLETDIAGNHLTLHFPRVTVNQALVFAIEVFAR